jgi:arylsulfatase A-like enzyme
MMGTIVSPAVFSAEARKRNRPNIVFILVDDMGWTGPACYGSDLHETPNIDRLAMEGVRFEQAYAASPVCTPTRASIMTGKTPARLNMTIWHEAAVERLRSKGDKPLAPPITEPNLDLAYVSLAEVLRDAGYQTAHVGKWHLGDAEHYPETQGFDVNIGGTLWGAPSTYWYPYHRERTTDAGNLEHRYVPALPFGKEGEYLTDRLTDEALGLMERMHEKPFFLSMCYYNPHTPIEGKPELVEYYRNKIKEGMTHTNARYAAMVHTLDENVGRLLDKLDELGVADNTMVVFYSDNGGFDQVRDDELVTSNVPLRSGKASLYEGGVRVPAIVKWPGHTPVNAVCNEPIVSTDLYPTILDALGSSASDVGCGELDGVSLRSLLENPESKLDRDTICFHFPHYYFNTSPVSAIRRGDWKLIEYYEDGHAELYNLKDDLGENTDLAAEKPDIAADLRQRLDQWREDVNAQLPEKNS